MRAYDQGSIYRVTCDARDVEDFKAHWPCSGIPNRSVSFTFDKRTGDLIDLQPENLDGEAAVALSQDAQEYGRKRLRLEAQ